MILTQPLMFATTGQHIIFSGLEIGEQIQFPSAAIEKGFDWADRHPVVEAYKIFKKMPYDRPLWDLTSVFYAVREKYGYFSLSPHGRVSVLENGTVNFHKDRLGPHQHLQFGAFRREAIQKELVRLCCFQPSVSRGRKRTTESTGRRMHVDFPY